MLIKLLANGQRFVSKLDFELPFVKLLWQICNQSEEEIF